MVRESLLVNLGVMALMGLQFLIAYFYRKPSNPLLFTVVSYVLGGAVIYVAGAMTSKHIDRGEDAVDLLRLTGSTWKMLFLFAGFWFAINSFFLLGLNASLKGDNISILIGLWVAASLVVPPAIELITKRMAFIHSLNIFEALGYAGILLSSGLLVYGQANK